MSGMKAGMICQTGPVIVRLENFADSDIWNIWQWKVDPYRISCAKEYNLSISLHAAEKQWNPEELLWEKQAGFFCSRIFAASCGDTLWQYSRIKNDEIVLRYRVSSAWDRIALLQDNSGTSGHLAFEYLGQMMPGIFLKHGVLTFHGVLMEHQGNGIIISAPSGTGKTTHARFWRDYKNALIINGDRASCYVKDGKWFGFGLPWSGTSGEQVNRRVPLKAIVILERGEYNEAHLIRGLEAFGGIFPHLQYPAWDKAMVNKAMENMEQLLCKIPVVRFQCRPDHESVDVLAQVLEEL